jgi:hypothetical protein
MTLGPIDLGAFRALVSDGSGYRFKDGRDLCTNPTLPETLAALANFYVKAAAHMRRGRQGEITVPYSKKNGQKWTLRAEPGEFITDVGDGAFTIRTGTYAAGWTIRCGDHEEPSKKECELRDRLAIPPDSTPATVQKIMSAFSQFTDRRCHFWSSVRQIKGVSFLGVVLLMAGQKVSLRTGGALAAGLGLLYAYARLRHRTYAEQAGFWYAASLAMQGIYAGSSWNDWRVDKNFRDPIDPWALQIGQGFIPRDEGFPQNATEAERNS